MQKVKMTRHILNYPAPLYSRLAVETRDNADSALIANEIAFAQRMEFRKRKLKYSAVFIDRNWISAVIACPFPAITWNAPAGFTGGPGLLNQGGHH